MTTLQNARSVRLKSAVWFAFLLLLGTGTGFGIEIRQHGLDITVALPAGYEDIKALPGMQNELVAVGKWSANKDRIDRFLSISALGGAIGREDISDAVPKKPGVSLSKAKWKSFEVDRFRVVEEAGGNSWITYNVQVPTVPRAVQVKVFGPASEEADLQKLLSATLGSLESETNWLNSSERADHFMKGILGLTITAMVILMIVRVFRRPKPKVKTDTW